MKILIAVPCMDQVATQFCQSLVMLNKVGECYVSFQVSSLIYTSRDQLSKKAIKSGVDYILWLDSDMTFEPDTLERMLAEIKPETILTGLYFRRVAPFHPVLFDKLEVKEDGCEWSDFENIPDKPFEVGGCGFGCVLMPIEAIVSVSLNFKQLFTPVHGMGEDLAFCWRARQSGFKIICDPSISLGHVGHTVVNRDFYDTYQKTLKE